jgi:5'-3' exonuclease
LDQHVDRPFLIIDGLNVHTRHFVANPTMSALGHHVGGITGFLKSIELLVQKTAPQRVVVIWEGGGSPRRRAIYPDYKSKRKPQKLNRYYEGDIPDTVENRNYQIMLLIELLRLTPVNQVYVSDCEADDVIGYLIRYKFKGKRCVIVSSDKDYYQLLSNKVTQWSPGQRKFISNDIVLEKFGIPVHNFCVARSFIGDPSDGIPGIRGAGFKTLAKRFPEFCGEDDISVNDIIELSKSKCLSSKIKLFKEINSNCEIARRNWKLMYLDMMNLSASQIQKIESSIDTFEPERNKIEFMRTMIREGISTFNTDAFYMSLNSISR